MIELLLVGFFGAELYANAWNYDSLQVVSYTVDYLKIISMFGLSIFMVNMFSGVYDGLGLTIITFLVTASGLVLNIVLDPLFILDQVTVFGLTINGLGLTVKGAAMATAISQAFVLLVYLSLFLTKKKKFDLRITSSKA